MSRLSTRRVNEIILHTLPTFAVFFFPSIASHLKKSFRYSRRDGTYRCGYAVVLYTAIYNDQHSHHTKEVDLLIRFWLMIDRILIIITGRCIFSSCTLIRSFFAFIQSGIRFIIVYFLRRVTPQRRETLQGCI